MKSTACRWTFLATALVLALVALPALGQDDEPEPVEAPAEPAPEEPEKTEPEEPAAAAEPSRGLRLYAEVGTWIAQAAGLEYEPATRIDPLAPLDTQILALTHSTEQSSRYRAGFDIGGGHGGVVLTYFAHQDEAAMTRSEPSNFVFGQLLSYPLLAGFGNDGLADGFAADAATKLRDLRVDYYRTAFESDRAEGRWYVGYREVSHSRTFDASYYALEPLLPPLFPPFVETPRPDLEPLPETAFVASDFHGRGVEAGLDILVPFDRGRRLTLEAGLNVAALRGDTEVAYRSRNAYYLLLDAQGNPERILSPPYDEFEQIDPPPAGQPVGSPTVNRIRQLEQVVGLHIPSRSSSAGVIEARLGLRARLWKTLELFGGFQSTRYDGVGVDLRPTVGVSGSTGTNLQAVTEEERSATYEGFYFGVSVSF